MLYGNVEIFVANHVQSDGMMQFLQITGTFLPLLI